MKTYVRPAQMSEWAGSRLIKLQIGFPDKGSGPGSGRSLVDPDAELPFISRI